MRRMRVIGLCIVAVMAASAVSAASSSAALPEFKTAKFPVEFKAEGEKATFHSSLINVECKSTLTTGKVTSTKNMVMDVIYSSCVNGGSMDLCSTPGTLGKGTLLSKELAGEAIYVEPPGIEAGVIMGPNFGKVITEFTCEGSLLGTVKLEGCIEGEITPLNKSVGVGDIAYLENATHDGPKWNDKEDCTLRMVALGETYKSWLTVGEEIIFKENVELKA
jgi:hypothetical protein